jgi:hypothetical protein
MSGWYLAHVEVENFKSIVRASVQLQEGMTGMMNKVYLISEGKY